MYRQRANQHLLSFIRHCSSKTDLAAWAVRSAAASFANIQHRGQFDRKLLQQLFGSSHTSSSKMKMLFVRRASYHSMCPATDRRNQPWWTRHDGSQALPTTSEVGLVCWMMAFQVHRFADVMWLFLARAYGWVTLSVYLGEYDCFKFNQKEKKEKIPKLNAQAAGGIWACKTQKT